MPHCQHLSCDLVHCLMHAEQQSGITALQQLTADHAKQNDTFAGIENGPWKWDVSGCQVTLDSMRYAQAWAHACPCMGWIHNCSDLISALSVYYSHYSHAHPTNAMPGGCSALACSKTPSCPFDTPRIDIPRSPGLLPVWMLASVRPDQQLQYRRNQMYSLCRHE